MIIRSKPSLELHSRAAPSVEAHHCSDSPDAGRNSGGRWIINKNKYDYTYTYTKYINFKYIHSVHLFYTL